ncbi:ubiquinone biosynthesis protein COQ9 [Shimia gijangensis]|uniref:Ubiquinone biosynthesis protein COQ9 n=1 Tax=Shimia gijangensis TaxID=1470563 RepID=A0A1M6BFL2_9RHOB|nr:COQ9 family protein [Shimia gijangensis]SHI47476.1 ubiquinone biosynthesis protein COQ9 [Shimia gijangensis]
MTTPDPKSKLLDAALDHVAFDGWSKATFDAAIEDCGVEPALAHSVCPRGAVDLAVAFHKRGDGEMVTRFETEEVSDLRYSEKVAALVRFRLEACTDKEAVRRGTTLFSLPQYAGIGAELIWGTCDAIWNALGDSSEDFNWYTKRATLSGVYGSTVLYWLGDDSEDHAATWAFLDRRIENVMQFEKAKAQFKASPFGKLVQGPLSALEKIKKPGASHDMPGVWRGES